MIIEPLPRVNIPLRIFSSCVSSMALREHVKMIDTNKKRAAVDPNSSNTMN